MHAHQIGAKTRKRESLLALHNNNSTHYGHSHKKIASHLHNMTAADRPLNTTLDSTTPWLLHVSVPEQNPQLRPHMQSQAAGRNCEHVDRSRSKPCKKELFVSTGLSYVAGLITTLIPERNNCNATSRQHMVHEQYKT